uniref:LIM zinc-binding domain-containing protein n=1 Tax=Electrophorus electricus TaxID=8005 RepID=A0AAY5EVB8_ELEEL
MLFWGSTINRSIRDIRVPRSELCTGCQKRVYPMEGLLVDKKKFHKACFSCEYCKNKLNLGNYVSLHGHLYCPSHYKQLFKSKGYFDEVFGQGSQKLVPNKDSTEFILCVCICHI